MVEYIYDNPSRSPQESPDWKSLDHRQGDCYIENLNELQELLRKDLQTTNDIQARLALWSCLLGYCEALSTHKHIRHAIYPIPIDALHRLVEAEFTPPSVYNATTHRQAAQIVSNWVWDQVAPKPNVKDELHANSLYTCLRAATNNKKSLDCFGAALITVIGLRQLGYETSMLTLSEDHAYESHYDENESRIHTCEVAIPGTTKAQKAKRGQEIAFSNSKVLTPQTSWLYMGMGPVYCTTAPMILAAALANLNCLIESKHNGKIELNSEPLLLLKRELLWILKDAGHLDEFPFALCELGWSEEHCTSARGGHMVSMPDLAPVPVTTIERLYHEAILCSQRRYDDRQVYPYTYMGYYHKDGGQEDEYRFGVALKYFYHAARVASRYTYQWGDSLQLTKIFTKISEYILHEIWCSRGGIPRAWQDPQNVVTAASWMLAFFDALLMWEELSNDRFLPILQTNHKTGIAKIFSLLPQEVRVKAFVCLAEEKDGDVKAIPELQSKRLQGMLGEALQKPKVSISDLHLTIVVSECRQRRKRSRT